MSKIDCEACSDLREYAPNFVANGVTEDVCESLMNDTGLNPCLETLHTNCEDLHDANDCLIGTMDSKIEAHDVCDWKEYMHKLMPNLYEMLKALICSICGLWEQIHKLWCWIERVVEEPTQYAVHVYEDDDPTKRPINGFRIAKGVTMRQPGPGSAPITLRILGNNAFLTGSLTFNGEMPSDYTNGQSVEWSYLKQGCSSLTDKAGRAWGANGQCANQPLIYEFEITPCEYGFKRFWREPTLRQAAAGDFNMTVNVYSKGATVPPDYSTRLKSTSPEEYYDGYYTYDPSDASKILIQVRLQDTRHSLGDVTPNGLGIVIPCTEEWEC